MMFERLFGAIELIAFLYIKTIIQVSENTNFIYLQLVQIVVLYTLVQGR